MASLSPIVRISALSAVVSMTACAPASPDADPGPVDEVETASTDGSTDGTPVESLPVEPAPSIRVAPVTEADVCATLRRNLLGPSGAPIESIDIEAARDALGQGGDDRAVVLQQLLGGGEDARALVGDLQPLIDDGDVGTRRGAWAAMVASDPASVVELARPMLRDPNANAASRDEAARALAMTGRAGLAALTSAAREEDPMLRAIARSGLRTSLAWPLAARDVLFAEGGWCAEPTDPVCVELARGIAQGDPQWLARSAVSSPRFRVLALEYAAVTDETSPMTWIETIGAAGMLPHERLDSARIIAGYGYAGPAAIVAAGALVEGLEDPALRQTAARLVLDGAEGLGDHAEPLAAFAEGGGPGSLFVAGALYRANGGIHAAPGQVLEVIGTPSHPEREVAISLAATVGLVGFDVDEAPLADDERAFATALRTRDSEALVRMAPRMAHQHLVDRGLEIYLAGPDGASRIDAIVEAIGTDDGPADRWLRLGARLGEVGAPFAPLAIGRTLDTVPDAHTARWWDERGGRDAIVGAIEAGLGSGHLATRRRALIVAGALGISPDSDTLVSVLTAGAHAVQLETGDLRRLAAGLIARSGASDPFAALALREQMRPGMPGHTPAGLVALAALTHCTDN